MFYRYATIFLTILSLTLAFMLGVKESKAQAGDGIKVIATGGGNADPTLFLVNPGTKTICVYQVQADRLRFIAKRTYTRDFYIKDFRTRQ